MSIDHEGIPLQWLAGTHPSAVAKMLRHKIDPVYIRPSRLDVEAQKAICISKRCTCLYYEVGATIFHVKDKNFFFLSDGYNGASRGAPEVRAEVPVVSKRIP